MKALCSEAALMSLRRMYPQVYLSSFRLELDHSKLEVTRGDFAAAMSKLIPSSRRSKATISRQLDVAGIPLLINSLNRAIAIVKRLFPICAATISGQNTESSNAVSSRNDMWSHAEWIASVTDVQIRGNETSLWNPSAVMSKPRMIICGKSSMGQAEIAGALLQRLESFQVFSLEYSSLLADINYHSPEQALVSRIQDAIAAAPSIIYIPDILCWWVSATDGMRTSILSTIESISTSLPVLWISTLVYDDQKINGMSLQSFLSTNTSAVSSSTSSNNDNEDETDSKGGEYTVNDERLMHLLRWLSGMDSTAYMQSKGCNSDAIWRASGMYHVGFSTSDERHAFFSPFFNSLRTLPTIIYDARLQIITSRNQEVRVLPKADMKQQQQVPKSGSKVILSNGETERQKNYLREQRVFFRAAIAELLKEKKFFSLWRPVEPEQVPDYYDIVSSPMDLETMRCKVDDGLYPTYKSFIYDIEQIIYNAKTYNPLNAKDSRGRTIVSAAHNMLDVVETHAYGFKKRLKYDVFQKCQDIYKSSKGVNADEIVQDRDKMPPENKPYYASVLKRHAEIKLEEHLDNKTHEDIDKEIKSYEVSAVDCDSNFSKSRPSQRRSSRLNADVAMSSSYDLETKPVDKDDKQVPEVIDEAIVDDVTTSNSINETVSWKFVDVDLCPLMQSLKSSVAYSEEVSYLCT
jgi:hypothetical protein